MAQLNKFFDTAVGKSLQTFLWTFAAYAITVVIAYVAKVQWSDQYLALGVPGLINWALYSAKVTIDKEVPTLPSSTPMVLIPKVDINNQPVTLPPSVLSPLPDPAIDDVSASDFLDSLKHDPSTNDPTSGNETTIKVSTDTTDNNIS